MPTLNLSQVEVDMICNAFTLLINDISTSALNKDSNADADCEDTPDQEMICSKLSDLSARIKSGLRSLTNCEVRCICYALDYFSDKCSRKAYAYRILRNRFPSNP